MTLALLSAVAFVALGIAAVRHLLPAGDLPSRLLVLALGAGLGCGLASCLTFVVGWSMGGLSRSVLAAEIGILIVAMLILTRLRPTPLHHTAPELGARGETQRGYSALLLTGSGLVLILGAARFTLLAWVWPHGQWDAWAIWNLRARFLARALGDWTSAFRIAEGHPYYLGSFGHPDYPLLLPLTIARAWVWTGGEPTMVPRLVAAGFLIATVVVLMAGLGALRGVTSAALGGAALLALPWVVFLAAWQYADLPLAFYFLATIVALAYARLSPGDPRALVLAGMLAGLSAWAKNEGWLFVVVVLIVCVSTGWLRDGLRGSLGDGRALLTGLLPIAVIVLGFKAALAPPNDLVTGQSLAEALRKLVTPERHGEVLRASVGATIQVAGPLVWALPLYAAFGGIARSRQSVAAAVTGGTIIGLTALGYHVVYVCTPLDLTWHLEQSLTRLVTQLAPASIFVVWLGLRGDD